MQFALIPQIHLENVLWDCVTLQDRQGFNALSLPKACFSGTGGTITPGFPRVSWL